MDTLEELKQNAHEARYDANKPACHKCGAVEGKVDVVPCAHLTCNRSVCGECATEIEWELEACSDHALNVYRGVREMFRDALRRAQDRRAA
jgi:hypothetical protein